MQVIQKITPFYGSTIKPKRQSSFIPLSLEIQRS